MKILRIGLIGGIAITTLLSTARAASIFTLIQDGCTGSCGIGPFGTITLVQTTATLVTVTEVLSDLERFAGTGAGDALEFNVAGPITIGGITAGFAIGPSPDTASTFGTFLASITCTECKCGNASNSPGPLSFTVTSATGVTIADFKANAGGYYFASDIVGTNGNSGNVAAYGASAPTPEPGTLFTLLTGVGLIGLSTRLRRFGRKGVAQPASTSLLCTASAEIGRGTR